MEWHSALTHQKLTSKKFLYNSSPVQSVDANSSLPQPSNIIISLQPNLGLNIKPVSFGYNVEFTIIHKRAITICSHFRPCCSQSRGEKVSDALANPTILLFDNQGLSKWGKVGKDYQLCALSMDLSYPVNDYLSNTRRYSWREIWKDQTNERSSGNTVQILSKVLSKPA